MRKFRIPIIIGTLNFILLGYFIAFQNYSWLLVLTQIGSIGALILSQLSPRKYLYTIQKHTSEIEIGVAIVLISFFVRIYRIDQITPGIWGDEITVARMALDLQKAPNFVPFVSTNYGHPTPLLYLTSMDITLLGKSLLSIRLVSVVFGTLAVLALYVLLRQRFSVPLASIGSLLFSIAYGNIIVSRLAYEQTASLFFQIVCYLLLYLFWKKGKSSYLILLGCVLGFGLWTYLAFRLIALGVLILLGVLVAKKHGLRAALSRIALCIFGVWVSTVMLSSYAVRHPTELMARVNSVSVFTQNLTLTEKIKELGGSAVRTMAIFFLKGDPNPRQNPSITSYFDIATLLLLYIGCFWVIRKNHSSVWIGALLLIPLLLNDILSTEFIPEFHYYGSGHPNALRIAGLLPIVYILVVYAIREISKHLELKKWNVSEWAVCGLMAAPILLLNWHAYFDQPFNNFIYTTNGVREYDATQAINSLGSGQFLVSPSIKNDVRYQLFINPTIQAHDFSPSVSTASALKIDSGQTVVFDPRQNLDLTTSLIQEFTSESSLYKSAYIRNAKDEIEIIVFTKK